MSSHLLSAALALLLILGLGVGVYLLRSAPVDRSSEPTPATSGAPRPDVRPPPPQTVLRTAPATTAAATPTSPRPQPLSAAQAAEHPAGSLVQLPDGTFLPVLNGARGAPPLPWANGRPWSKIVRIETGPKGYQWFVHSDGTQSITHMTFDSRFAGQVPVSNAFHPGAAPLPVLDEAAAKGVDKTPPPDPPHK